MSEKLAIYGGEKAKTTPNYPMYPGGLEIGDAEKKEVLEVLDNKYLFRYYGPEGVESKVRKFENNFKAKMGAKHCLATSSCTVGSCSPGRSTPSEIPITIWSRI